MGVLSNLLPPVQHIAQRVVIIDSTSKKVPFKKCLLAESMTHVVDLERSRESPEAKPNSA